MICGRLVYALFLLMPFRLCMCLLVSGRSVGRAFLMNVCCGRVFHSLGLKSASDRVFPGIGNDSILLCVASVFRRSALAKWLGSSTVLRRLEERP